jgi:dipeptidyl aminopeptidase/acylaminoacyl peptidase
MPFARARLIGALNRPLSRKQTQGVERGDWGFSRGSDENGMNLPKGAIVNNGDVFAAIEYNQNFIHEMRKKIMARKSLSARILIAASFLLMLCVVVTAQNKIAPRPVKQYTIEQFMDTTRVGGSSFSPDEESVLFHSNTSGIFNVYSIPVTGGEPKQLTTSTKDSTYAVAYFPNDSRFIYTYDKGGNENNHLYVRMPDGSEKDLTPGEKTKANFLGWSKDEKAFYVSTNERDARFFDIYRMSVADFSRSLLFQNDRGLDYADISRDEKLIAFNKQNEATNDADIYLYNRETKQLKNLTEHKGAVAFAAQSFDPASRYLYFTTDEGTEFTALMRFDLTSGKHEAVEKYSWDIWGTYFSHGGKYRVVTINEDARTRVKVYDTRTNKPIELPKMAEGDITGVNISRSERLMAFYVNGSRTPNDLHIYHFATKRVTKLTNSLNPAIDRNDLVEAQVVRYQSFDGLEIPSILYKPQQASASNKRPAMLWIHGGPGGQTRTNYSAQMQFWANRGYVILGVNNRGSSGYGKTFFTADDGKHGREPLWDCVAAKKYLKSLGYVDENRVGIMGLSYGGYMVLAALAFKPEEFTVGVDMFGVSNWVRTLESIPPYWQSIRQFLYNEVGNPATQGAYLREISPLFHADKIKKPLLVLQGANDPRVIKAESDGIVEAIKRNGGTVEYIVFDDEGHGFSKKANEIRAYKAIADFLDKHLKESN